MPLKAATNRMELVDMTREFQLLWQHRRIVRGWKNPVEVFPDDEADFISFFGNEPFPAHPLISEDEFLAQHSEPPSGILGWICHWWRGPVGVIIKIPIDYQYDVELKANVRFLSETVRSLKDRIAQATGVPANKQNLISPNGTAGELEDNFSLAHYNVGGDDNMLFLSIEDSVARLAMKRPFNGIIT